MNVTLYELMFEGTCPPTVTMPATTPCASTEVVGDVIVVVTVVVDTEVALSRLLDPAKYPAPAPASIATTSNPATAAPFMEVESTTPERAIRLAT